MSLSERWHVIIRHLGELGEVWQVGSTQGAGALNTDALTPDEEQLQLAGNWSVTWAWPEDAYPGSRIEPATVSATIRVPSAAALPPIDQGDDFDVWLFCLSPEDGISTMYHDVLTCDEPTLNAYSGGLLLDLVLVDKLAALAEQNVGAVPFPAGQLPSPRLAAIAEAGGFNLSYTGEAWVDWVYLAAVDVDNRPALDLLYQTLNGVLYNDRDVVVLRYRNLEPQYVDLAGDAGGYPLPDKPLTYTVQRLNVTDTAADLPYQWVVVDDVLTYQVVEDVTAVGGRLMVPAKAVEVNDVTWRKSRDDSTNQLKLTGLTSAGEEATGVASHPGLVKRYGPNERQVETHTQSDYAGLPNLLNTYAERLLPEYDAALPVWSVPEFTIRTDQLTDDELANISRNLWPSNAVTFPDSIDIPVALLGIAAPWWVDGKVDLHGVLLGAKLGVAKGVLTIEGKLRGHVLRPWSEHWQALRWQDLRADAVTWGPVQLRPDAATPTEQAIDPRITLRDLRLIGAMS